MKSPFLISLLSCVLAGASFNAVAQSMAEEAGSGESRQKEIQVNAHALVNELDAMIDEDQRNGQPEDDIKDLKSLRGILSKLSEKGMARVLVLLRRAGVRTDPAGAFKVIAAAYSAPQGSSVETKQILAAPATEEETSTTAAGAEVFTYHNDNFNDGQNLNESALTPANVNISTFAKLYSVALDAGSRSQPVFMSGLNITTGPQQGVQDVVFITTLNNSLYAINADNGTVLWKTSLLYPFHGGTPTANPGWGILDTPAIDPATDAIYVESDQIESGHCEFVLSALNLSDGAYYANPALIVESDADDNYVSGPTVNKIGGGETVFQDGDQVCRCLILNPVNNVVYTSYSDPSDGGPYNGWIIGYSAVKDGSGNLDLNTVWCDTLQARGGGIWGAGGALALDGSGNLYATTGNGPFETTLIPAPYSGRLSTDIADLQVPSQGDYSDSVVKLTPDTDTSQQPDNPNGYGLHVADYFTPKDEYVMEANDLDFSSSGPVLLPDSVGSSAHQQLLFANNKQGNIYLIDRNNMGGYNGDAAGDGESGTDNIVQEMIGATQGAWSTGAFYAAGSAAAGTFYYAAVSDVARAYSITNAQINPTPISTSSNSYGTYSYPGSTPSISANGGSNGILWTLDRVQNLLIAYDASNLDTVLFRSNQGTGNGLVGSLGGFSVPTVANGHVYVAGSALTVYGLTGTVGPPSITSPATALGTVGSAFNYQITATGSATGYNATGLPGGLSVNTGSGLISGTPGGSGVSIVNLSAINASGTGTAPLTLIISGTSGGGSGGSIGLDFSGGGTQIPVGTSAGVVSQSNWNNLSTAAPGSVLTVLDSTGVTASGVSATWTSYNGGANGLYRFVSSSFPNPGDSDLFSETWFVYSSGPGSGWGQVFTVNGIPYASYDVYVYSEGASGMAGLVNLNGTFTSTSPTGGISVQFTEMGNMSNYVKADGTPATQANYVLFSGVSGSTLTINAQVGQSSAGGLVGIQIVSLTGTGSPPSTPARLSATAGNAQVSLNWTASSGAASYNIYRGTSAGAESTTPIAASITGTAYTDTGLNNGTAYYYKVAAVNSSGTSGYSNEASAIPDPTYSQWASSYFASNPANGGETANPENDGVVNLLKYLFDIDPVVAMKASDWAALPSAGIVTLSGSTYLTLTYRKSILATGLTINTQTCTDLKSWQTLTPNQILTTGTDLTTGDPFIQFQVWVNPPSASKEFIRLNVTGP